MLCYCLAGAPCRYEAAAFFADKLVTLSGYAPAEVYTLAQVGVPLVQLSWLLGGIGVCTPVASCTPRAVGDGARAQSCALGCYAPAQRGWVPSVPPRCVPSLR